MSLQCATASSASSSCFRQPPRSGRSRAGRSCSCFSSWSFRPLAELSPNAGATTSLSASGPLGSRQRRRPLSLRGVLGGPPEAPAAAMAAATANAAEEYPLPRGGQLPPLPERGVVVPLLSPLQLCRALPGRDVLPARGVAGPPLPRGRAVPAPELKLRLFAVEKLGWKVQPSSALASCKARSSSRLHSQTSFSRRSCSWRGAPLGRCLDAMRLLLGSVCGQKRSTCSSLLLLDVRALSF
mmetsp:Transcript_9240/g.20538  ORF Transcript_9240/g.20538 Transcript_9240/m.20538 type:complete len:240 (-) Transcript_9240:1887-2606(-)